MSAQPAPIADLGRALDRLEHELAAIAELEGTSPGYFCARMLPILAALADATISARVALEPIMASEMHRANAAHRFLADMPAGES